MNAREKKMLKEGVLSAVLGVAVALVLQILILRFTAEAAAPTNTSRLPQPGIVLRGKVTGVYDGDTPTVECTVRMRVRLLDCWCPEIKGTSGMEKELALKARERAKELALGKEVRLEVPEMGDDLGDSTTMGRLLGRLWIEERGETLNEILVREKLAATAKGRRLGE